jgi:drug/metabolite transporter (DMT)-like permease
LLIQGIYFMNGSFPAGHFWGNMLVIGAAASESAFNVCSRDYARKSFDPGKEPVHPMVQTTIVSAFAFSFCLLPALLENPFQRLAAIGVYEWLALFWYGVFVTALAFICWFSGIRRCSALASAAFTGMMPFTSMVLSVVVLGETAGWTQWSGGLLVMAGMVLIGMA